MDYQHQRSWLAELFADFPDDALTTMLWKGIESSPEFSPAARENQAGESLPPVFILWAGSLMDETFSLETPDGWQHFYNVTAGRTIAEARGDVLSFVPGDAGVTLESLRDVYDGLDENYALNRLTDRDLRRPVLFILFRGKPQLIDGWHRLFRAVATGKARRPLPAYVLTEEEAERILLVRLPPGSGLDWGRDSDSVKQKRGT